jgi:2-C-methyl-D-erythritol 4-phosphate cytidylyltransferase
MSVRYSTTHVHYPQLNPVEQLWLNIKQRYLSNMAFKDYEEILQATFTKDIVFGKYCLKRPLAFSFCPRSQE